MAKKAARKKKKTATKAGTARRGKGSSGASGRSKKASRKKPSPTRTAKKSPRKKSTPKKATRAPKRPTSKTKTAKSVGRPSRGKAKAKRSDKKRPRRTSAATRERRRRLKGFRDLLLEKYQQLLQSYRSSKGNTRELGSDGTEDYIDYAVSSYDRDFTLSLSEMERYQLLLVEDALKRIDSGNYGRCQQCDKEIPERRLEAEPWARHCIRCQELEEQGLLQQRPFEVDYDEGEDEPEPEDEIDIETDEEDEKDEDEEGDEDEEDELKGTVGPESDEAETEDEDQLSL